jgi:hypothetical protein
VQWTFLKPYQSFNLPPKDSESFPQPLEGPVLFPKTSCAISAIYSNNVISAFEELLVNGDIIPHL